MSNILNIAGYKFINLSPSMLSHLAETYKKSASALQLKGTILLSTEGINLVLAGETKSIESFQDILFSNSDFKDIHFKKSYSEFIPFKRLYIKIKKEIITFGKIATQPTTKTAPYISPQQLKEWYQQQHDMIILDTRNDYEYAVGKFKGAEQLEIESFTQFKQAISKLPDSYKTKPIVTYCTGGIRCEKAALYLQEQGFQEVYQLEGGILNYLEQCGNEYYEGNCFVFDDRISLDAQLKPYTKS